jgi:hypothetical protein
MRHTTRQIAQSIIALCPSTIHALATSQRLRWPQLGIEILLNQWRMSMRLIDMPVFLGGVFWEGWSGVGFLVFPMCSQLVPQILNLFLNLFSIASHIVSYGLPQIFSWNSYNWVNIEPIYIYLIFGVNISIGGRVGDVTLLWWVNQRGWLEK